MTNPLVVLPGWGLKSQALQPLLDELQSLLPSFNLQLHPLANPLDKCPKAIVQQLDKELPQNSWLVGWSLGGMLATALAAQRQTACAGVISYASNACFLANKHWPNALDSNTFDAFYQLCQEDLSKGLKRFSLLSSQGAEEARLLAKKLPAMALVQNTATVLAGLNLLANLDNRPAITDFTGRQLHLLAGKDALVPSKVASDLQALNPLARVALLGQSHASPVAEAGLLAKHLAAFILDKSNA